MKYLVYNFLLFSRGIFIFASKIISLCFLVLGLCFVIFETELLMKVTGAFFIIIPFLIFLIRDQYDNLIFKIKPGNVSLRLKI